MQASTISNKNNCKELIPTIRKYIDNTLQDKNFPLSKLSTNLPVFIDNTAQFIPLSSKDLLNGHIKINSPSSICCATLPLPQELCKEAEKCLCRKIEEGDTFSFTIVSNIAMYLLEEISLWSDFNSRTWINCGDCFPANVSVQFWVRFKSCDEYEVIRPVIQNNVVASISTIRPITHNNVATK